MSSSGECASCKAPVHWAITPKGERAPLNLQPDAEKGNTLLLQPSALGGGLLAVVLSGKLLEEVRVRGGGRWLFLSHWADCPDRAAWRERTDAKRKAEGGDG